MTYWKLSTIIILKYIFAEGKSVVRVWTLPKHLETCFLSSHMSWIYLKSGKTLEPSRYIQCAQDQLGTVWLIEDSQTAGVWGGMENECAAWTSVKAWPCAFWGSQQHCMFIFDGKIFACKEFFLKQVLKCWCFYMRDCVTHKLLISFCCLFLIAKI